MSLKRLNVVDVRNISAVELDFHPDINLIVGNNGSGKTTILESVYILSTGKSFRSNKIANLVARSRDKLTVFGSSEVDQKLVNIGVTRYLDGSKEIRLNSEALLQTSLLAKELPLLVLSPDTLELVVGAPQVRRKFLNWGVFHVEHEFQSHWVSANNCLKQRNRLLRDNFKVVPELDSWSKSLVEFSESITEFRESYFKEFKQVFLRLCTLLETPKGLEVTFQRGWDKKRNLKDCVQEQTESDLRRGFTQSGFHRADLKFQLNGVSAAEICSRGELKTIAWAAVLAQGEMFSSISARKPIYLVDDLAAEMDLAHAKKTCDWLGSSEAQIVATGIDERWLRSCWHKKQGKVFHVEHGKILKEERLGD